MEDTEVLHCEHHEFVVVDLGALGDAVLLPLNLINFSNTKRWEGAR